MSNSFSRRLTIGQQWSRGETVLTITQIHRKDRVVEVVYDGSGERGLKTFADLKTLYTPRTIYVENE